MIYSIEYEQFFYNQSFKTIKEKTAFNIGLNNFYRIRRINIVLDNTKLHIIHK